jgi:hypothetical protein
MSDIPKHIHFFWATSYLPREAFDNIVSFIANTDPSWEITLWTDNIDFIKKSPFLPQGLDSCFPARVEIKELWNELDQGIEKLNTGSATLTNDILMETFGVR